MSMGPERFCSLLTPIIMRTRRVPEERFTDMGRILQIKALSLK